MRLVQVAGDLFCTHKELATLRQRSLLADFRRERFELGHRGAQIFGVAERGFERRTELRRFAFYAPQVAIARFDRLRVRLKPSECVEQPAMLLRADEGTVVV